MSVVNVKVSYIRPKYNNLKEWCKNSNNVYIGRKGIVFIDGARYPQKDSLWANPYKITKDETREDVIQKYEMYIRNRLKTEDGLLKQLLNLKDKNLGCWCHPESCHGDVLQKLIKEYSKI
jgi:hypothetical protein